MANAHIQKQSDSLAESVRERPAVPPRVDVYENREEFLVVADLPGVKSDALSINVENAELTLEATRSSTAAGALLVSEHRDLDFRRSFVLPQGIDRERIDAELKDGVLRLHLPKSDALRPRQIPVRAG
ncbi:MAG: Hsp20/alpha crystallin family protein [Polyangiaceae bacterium]|nr:Hsp20/alpha crystallin family protein [Polyangiaceae bacterium]